jgi:hypothetical protein
MLLMVGSPPTIFLELRTGTDHRKLLGYESQALSKKVDCTHPDHKSRFLQNLMVTAYLYTTEVIHNWTTSSYFIKLNGYI